MSKVLLVDTNFSSRPIFDELERLGHEVHVVGANPTDCLAKVSAHYWNLNYADTQALSALVDSELFEYLVPGCTDRSYSSCSIVGQGRFPGIASVKIDRDLNHKDRFRSIGQRLNLPVPRLQWQDGKNQSCSPFPSKDQLCWPLVVKPVDSFSGKGVTILHQQEEVAMLQAVSQARRASSRGKCLIEDYVQGQLHSHSAFLQSGRVVQDYFVEEHGTANPFVVDTSRVLPTVPDGLRIEMRQAIETLASELHLSDGLVHTQFILDGEKPWIIEITRRCPGDLYSQLIELSGGIGYVSNYVRPFLGLPVNVEDPQPYIPIMRHTVTVPVAQRFDHLEFRQALFLERWVPLTLTGDNLQPSPVSRIGIMFARTADVHQSNQLFATTLERQLYYIAP
jgi:formate-dependent phosphoribosylglycinamide formyltransferase (GAR transformylase)